MGWIPDLPDPRDFTFSNHAVLSQLRRLNRSLGKTSPPAIDLRADSEGMYFSTPPDQGPLNCSSAFAVLSLTEYFERRIKGKTFDGSCLFLYKVTRNRIGRGPRAVSDSGADLRSTIKAMLHFGVPPEEHWPYRVENVDQEPSPFLYQLAKPIPGAQYFRLDPANQDGSTTWRTLRSFLAAGFPVAFGFAVPSSLSHDSEILFRPDFDSPRAGQAVVAVGYENNHFGAGQHALLIRSSWGKQWGDNGNGWLPHAYVRRQLARDFWTMISEEWLDSAELHCPSVVS
jgi:C1A family cysteine protease